MRSTMSAKSPSVIRSRRSEVEGGTQEHGRASVDFSRQITDKLSVRATSYFDHTDNKIDQQNFTSYGAYLAVDYEPTSTTKVALQQTYQHFREGEYWGVPPIQQANGVRTLPYILART